MNLNKNIALSDSGFIFNPGSGDSFSTNPVGLEIIRMLKEGKSNTEIIQLLAQQYEVQESTLEKDLNDFISVLQNYQLVNNV